MVRAPIAALALVVWATSACERNAGSVSCGIDAFTGPLVVKESFGAGAALATAPESMPAGLPVRLVAGGAWHATTSRDSSGAWRIETHGSVSNLVHVGYGVLVVDFQNRVLGVLAFDAKSIRGAPGLGELAIGDTVVPLLGVRIDPARIQNASCPVFPDSLR